jgi:CHAT domain-containing protein
LIGDVDFRSDPGTASLADRETGAGFDYSRSAVRSRTDASFAPLPGTAQEIDKIRMLYRQEFAGHEPEMVSGSRATEQFFRTEASRHRFIHVATHGFFSAESALDPKEGNKQSSGDPLLEKAIDVRGFQPGLLSGIALAGANRKVDQEADKSTNAGKEHDDGILTALEVEGLDLANVDLVVLSACETGLGKAAGGEGVLGLQRAFQLAGAKTCITSLWKVDDTATQVLMSEFYRNLWVKKLGKLQSLRAAQLAMLKRYDPGKKRLRGLDVSDDNSAGPERGSPFYWAAFVLSGDWR